MTDPTEKIPPTVAPNAVQDTAEDDQIADPQDLVYSGGYVGNPREIVDNPAVAPEMLDNPEDLQDYLLRED